MPAPQPSKVYYDSLGPFPGGVNSQPHPLLIPKTQLSWMINGSNRGSFIQPRPAWVKVPLTFFTPDLQTLFEDFLFQGSGFFKSSVGVEQIVVQIGGRLFRMTLSGAGMLVEDITVPGDPNSPTAPIAWMNQALQWELIRDGTSANQIAYDGTVSRRLNPNVDTLGTTSAAFTTPDIGATVAVTLLTPFLGTLGQTVIIDGFMYSVTATGGSNQATIHNNNDTPGTPYSAGTQIYIDPNIYGTLFGTTSFASPVNYPAGTSTLISTTATIPNGSIVSIPDSVGFSFQFQIVSPAGAGFYNIKTLVNMFGPITFLPGAPISAVPGGAPVTSVATLAAPITAPSAGSSEVITLTSPYTGAAGQSVIIGSASYSITAIPSSTPGTNLTLTNLNAPSGVLTPPLNPPNPPPTAIAILSVPELPPGRQGAYGQGHEAMALLNGTDFIYGDTDGGPSGSVTYNYQDAVLKTTENTFLSGGGTFRIPASGQQIQSMNFPANLNAALGQGPLQIGIQFGMFSCLVPTDRSEWVKLSNPILPMSLIGTGPLSQDGTISVNSDTFFRSYVGVGDLILAVRQFGQPAGNWGNTPISTEMIRVFQLDNTGLLQFGSAVNFDNRFHTTCSPQLNAAHGTYHRGLAAMNLDALSSLSGKLPACWDGLWTGLDILKLVTGTFNSVQRTFASVLNPNTSKIELWELLKTGSEIKWDNNQTPIQMAFETGAVFHPEERSKQDRTLKLNNGQIHLRNIYKTVHVKVLWRPDFWPCWVTWFEFDVCNSVPSQPGYITPAGLGEPPDTEPPESTGMPPFRFGRFFQLRVEITGYAEFMGADFEAVTAPEVVFAPPLTSIPCQTNNCVLPDDFAYHIE